MRPSLDARHGARRVVLHLVVHPVGAAHLPHAPRPVIHEPDPVARQRVARARQPAVRRIIGIVHLERPARIVHGNHPPPRVPPRRNRPPRLHRVGDAPRRVVLQPHPVGFRQPPLRVVGIGQRRRPPARKRHVGQPRRPVVLHRRHHPIRVRGRRQPPAPVVAIAHRTPQRIRRRRQPPVRRMPKRPQVGARIAHLRQPTRRVVVVRCRHPARIRHARQPTRAVIPIRRFAPQRIGLGNHPPIRVAPEPRGPAARIHGIRLPPQRVALQRERPARRIRRPHRQLLRVVLARFRQQPHRHVRRATVRPIAHLRAHPRGLDERLRPPAAVVFARHPAARPIHHARIVVHGIAPKCFRIPQRIHRPHQVPVRVVLERMARPRLVHGLRRAPQHVVVHTDARPVRVARRRQPKQLVMAIALAEPIRIRHGGQRAVRRIRIARLTARRPHRRNRPPLRIVLNAPNRLRAVGDRRRVAAPVAQDRLRRSIRMHHPRQILENKIHVVPRTRVVERLRRRLVEIGQHLPVRVGDRFQPPPRRVVAQRRRPPQPVRHRADMPARIATQRDRVPRLIANRSRRHVVVVVVDKAVRPPVGIRHAAHEIPVGIAHRQRQPVPVRVRLRHAPRMDRRFRMQLRRCVLVRKRRVALRLHHRRQQGQVGRHVSRLVREIVGRIDEPRRRPVRPRHRPERQPPVVVRRVGLI